MSNEKTDTTAAPKMANEWLNDPERRAYVEREAANAVENMNKGKAVKNSPSPFDGFTFWFGPSAGNQHGTVNRGAIAFNGELVAIYKHNRETDLVTVVYEGKTKTTQAGGLKAEQVAEMLVRELTVEAKKAA